MINVEDKINCCGCHACYNICPQKAIEMLEDEKGFKYPKINKEKCINCDLCKKVCPILNKKQFENEIIAYACYNENDGERMKSSSGGIFILLAKEILKRDGIIFGAYLDEKFVVKHGYADNMYELKKFMGSKYVQSEIGETYKQAKNFLDEDKYVLYTGTPCQIEGLKSYLRKDYDKLYTQDIICHGVPSPLIWKKYLNYRRQKDNKEPKNIQFRAKDNGWNNFSMKFYYDESNKYIKDHSDDLFMQAFLRNTILRDSCYKCNFKNKNRNADITLADYWGVNQKDLDISDDKGVSLVLINTNKGKELFENIKEDIKFSKTNLEKAVQHNPSFSDSAKMDDNRDKFFKNIDSLKFDRLVKKYTYKKPMYKKIISKCKKAVKKLYKKI